MNLQKRFSKREEILKAVCCQLSVRSGGGAYSQPCGTEQGRVLKVLSEPPGLPGLKTL